MAHGTGTSGTRQFYLPTVARKQKASPPCPARAATAGVSIATSRPACVSVSPRSPFFGLATSEHEGGYQDAEGTRLLRADVRAGHENRCPFLSWRRLRTNTVVTSCRSMRGRRLRACTTNSQMLIGGRISLRAQCPVDVQAKLPSPLITRPPLLARASPRPRDHTRTMLK